jgi:anti-sigma factor RsiW
MDCTLDPHLLEGYLDGELGFERALEVEAHLTSCRACAAKVQGWKEIRGALQRSDLYYRASGQLERKIRDLASGASPQPASAQPASARPAWFERWLWAGGGAALATAALLAAFVLARPPQPSADQEIVASHVRSLMANHLMDVVSTDQHTVKPWFDGKLDFAPPVGDFPAQGFPLAGGRLDYLGTRTVAVLVYHRALHAINLYVWPAANAGTSSLREETLQGYHVVSWRKGGFEFRAVSDLNAEELREFAQLVGP